LICEVLIAFVQMSTEKLPESAQQSLAAKPSVPQSTSLFRAMNFELFVKPVRSYVCRLSSF